MSGTKAVLVLHLAGAPQPLQVALDQEEAKDLEGRLAELMTGGEVVSLSTEEGGQFVVNFAQIATAHIATGRIDANSYGAPTRGAGFGT